MSLQRVTTNLTNTNMQFHQRNREVDMNRLTNQVAGQSRIVNPRDDPIGAAHATRYVSYSNRLERFSDNIGFAQSNNQITEGYLMQAVDILQRVRELGVQGANGTFSTEDRRYMAGEVNQLLEQLIQVANGRNGDGTMVFSGNKVRTEPFRVLQGRVPGSGELLAAQVSYIGDIGQRQTEIADGAYVPLNLPGNAAFWAENQTIISDTDARAYQVDSDGMLYVNGVEVEVRRGDTTPAIISRINEAGAGVRARLDPVKNSIALETSSPRQIWLEEASGTTVFRDLGLIAPAGGEPPDNVPNDATVFGGSMFDVMIRMRDALYRGDVLDVGGQALQGIDSALGNVLSEVGRIGAINHRLDLAGRRTDNELLEMSGRRSAETDPNLPRAVTELRMLEYAHNATLGVTARVIQPTLLNFLR